MRTVSPHPPMLACVSAHVHVLGECLQTLEAAVTCQAARSASLCPPPFVFFFFSQVLTCDGRPCLLIGLLSRQLAYQDKGYLIKWRMSEASRLSLAVCSCSLTCFCLKSAERFEGTGELGYPTHFTHK